MLSMHYKEHLCHLIRVGHSRDFGFPSVGILPCFCRMQRKAMFTLTTANHC